MSLNRRYYYNYYYYYYYNESSAQLLWIVLGIISHQSGQRFSVELTLKLFVCGSHNIYVCCCWRVSMVSSVVS